MDEQEIQSSLLNLFVGKHRKARALRFYHKHLSPKALKRKKKKRKIVRESRRRNRRK